MPKTDGRDTRAVKKSVTAEIEIPGGKKSKKQLKKAMRYPAALIVAAFLIIGAVAGYFAATKTTYFALLPYKVDGVASENADYVTVDLSEKRAALEEQGKRADTAKEIADQLKIEDDGFEIKFLGSSVADTVSKKLLYREDLSEDAKEVAEIDFSRAGTYYVEYTSTHFAFKNLKLIRTIFVTGVEENG